MRKLANIIVKFIMSEEKRIKSHLFRAVTFDRTHFHCFILWTLLFHSLEFNVLKSGSYHYTLPYFTFQTKKLSIFNQQLM